MGIHKTAGLREARDATKNQSLWRLHTELFFCSLAFIDPRVGRTMDVLAPFVLILCHSD